MWRRLIYHPEINYALRQTLILSLPVAVGLMLGHLQQGLLFSLVPACCNIAGLDTPHKRFFKRLIIGASLFALSSLAVQLLLLQSVPLPLILLMLALLLGVTAEISPLHARLLPASLIAAIFTLSLAGNMPIWEPMLLYVLGTLWYGAFNGFWFWLWREQPLRESLSLIYKSLADYCEAKYSLLTRHTEPEQALPPLLVHQQKVVDQISQCYQQLQMLSATKQNGYKRLLRTFQVALDLQEHISVSLHQPAEVQKLVERSHAEEVLRWTAQTVATRLLPALKSYLSLKSAALRTAARLGVMLAAAGLLGSAFQLPKPYWILMTVLFVTQNGYGATRVRILHRAGGTLAGLIIAGITLHLNVPQGYTLLGMLLVTLISYLIIRRHYGWAMIGFTVTAVYSLQILTLNGEQYIVARLIDTLSGCLIAFGGMVWLWPQWQSGLLRQNAHDALEADQEALRLILSDDPQPGPLAWQRMQVNQAHNALYNSLNQAMQEPGFNSRYLEDMRLWVTHSQFIVEHINAITTMAREQTTLPPETAARYLQACEIALQRCQQRLEHDAPGDTQNEAVLEGEEVLPEGAPGVMEHHLLRILDHLRTMHTISSVAWRQRPHHGIWLRRRLSQPR
ncbi:FUSC family protein [Cronobacter universalis]|nr:FUSC family protein [Cronobacter universalis]